MKPIIFSTEMIKAILDGRKTQTRRIAKNIDEYINCECNARFTFNEVYEGYCVCCLHPLANGSVYDDKSFLRPRYQAGDILYVREAWQEECGEYYYRADYDDDYLSPCETMSGGYPDYCRYHPGCEGCTREPTPLKWRPSLHMPKSAARIFLRVKGVRVERVQDISPYDACCEGVQVLLPESLQREQAGLPPIIPDEWQGYSEEELKSAIENVARSEYMKKLFVAKQLVAGFQKLWDGINAKRGYPWESNCWVWVYEFERIEKPEV